MELVSRDLMGFGNKSARDLLTNLGMEDRNFSNAVEYRTLEKAFREAVPALGVSRLAHRDRSHIRNMEPALNRLSGEIVPNSVRLRDFG